MKKWFSEVLVPLLERWRVFRLILTAVSITSLVWGVWLTAFPMPDRLIALARPLGLLSAIFGILFGLAWQPRRPVRIAGWFFFAGWGLFALNFVLANIVEGVSQRAAVLFDLLQVFAFAGFFTVFALSFSFCIGSISSRLKPTAQKPQ